MSPTSVLPDYDASANVGRAVPDVHVHRHNRGHPANDLNLSAGGYGAWLGFDPVWFWLLFLVNITLGAITPPFGYTLFAFKVVVPGMSLADVYRATWPFVLLFLAGIALIIMVPGLAI